MKKKYAVGLGLVMGAAVAFGAMLPTAKDAFAAIQVVDERNIKEALRQAIKSAEILSKEEKKLALHIINTKSLNEKYLVRWIQKQHEISKSNREPFNQGLYKQQTTTEHILKNEMGSIERVFSGRGTLVDLYKKTQKNMEKIEENQVEIIKRTKKMEENNKKHAENIAEATEAGSKAEGQKEVQQAQLSVAASNAYINQDTNTLLAAQTSVMVMEGHQKNLEKAENLKQEETFKANFAEFAGSD